MDNQIFGFGLGTTRIIYLKIKSKACNQYRLFSFIVSKDNMKINILLTVFSFVFSLGINAQQMNHEQLYQKILDLDSTFFHAYNTCDMVTQQSFYNDTIEFYHDKSGLETSKEKILSDTKKYICGKVQRELVKGSIEVSPVPGYGAIEIGQHRFHNLKENTVSNPSKFVIVWKNDVGKWTITKVISLH